MIWHVVVGYGRYVQQPDGGDRVQERGSRHVVVEADTRVEAELIAAQIVAHCGMPLWTETQYDW